jgi:fatty acid CoA ligase FadD9
VSLDSFVDWLQEAGYQIEREPHYVRWLQQFEARLRALPDEKRQRSVLAVLHGYGMPLAGSHGIDNSVFVNAVSKLPVRQVPHIDRALIDKYLHDFQLLGFIHEPQDNAVSA